jgi:hypothetical protein
MIIGKFQLTDHSYHGAIHTPTLDREVSFEAIG